MEYLCCCLPLFILAPLLFDSLRAVGGTLREECGRAFWAALVLGVPPGLVVMIAVDAARVPSPPWLLVPLDYLSAALVVAVVFALVLGLRLRFAPTEREKLDPEELPY
ncbi:MAG: hypothetical protein R3F62_29860 [Planctomycetota bacterium]